MRNIEDMSTVKRRASSEASGKYQDRRFGLFVHWGLYAMLGRGEWVMHTEQIPVAEYEKLPQRFNPVQFDADAWARLMVETGQKYMVITSKHHDGFCMYDSEHTDYKITNTAFGRDPVAELAEAFAARDLKLGFTIRFSTGTILNTGITGRRMWNTTRPRCVSSVQNMAISA